MKKIKRNILLNPGPATTSDSVKYAQVVPDICPRESEFGDVMEYISKELTGFIADTDEYTAVLFGGSGTGAVEAVISSAVPYSKSGEKKLIIINNGIYGERMCKIAAIYKIPFIEFKSPLFKPLDILRLKKVIQKQKGLTHLAVVHNETTTGLLNDIKSIGALCGEYDIEMIVDAMSSYAGIPINMKEMNICFLMSTSNKNIQGMAGVSFVICSIKSLNKLKTMRPRNYYFDLYGQYLYFLKNRQMRFTPPVQTLYALKQAVCELKAETVEGRHERYGKNWEVLINGLKKIGLKLPIEEQYQSKIITTVIEPENKKYSFKKMHDFLLKRGFTVYPGKAGGRKTFRIANIGAINENDIQKFLAELAHYMHKIG